MRATVYEVGPRDGLQSIPEFIPSAAKFELISHLYAAGLENIEEVSFAHPKLLPQMADAEEVFTGRGAALVMNRRGYDRAVATNVEKINLVFSACNVFNKKILERRAQKQLMSILLSLTMCLVKTFVYTYRWLSARQIVESTTN
jgi:hydroxymethylglutaryl-CoA lyase